MKLTIVNFQILKKANWYLKLQRKFSVWKSLIFGTWLCPGIWRRLWEERVCFFLNLSQKLPTLILFWHFVCISRKEFHSKEESFTQRKAKISGMLEQFVKPINNVLSTTHKSLSACWKFLSGVIAIQVILFF